MNDEDVFENQGKARAIYHVSLGVADISRARNFYCAILEPLGYRLLHEVEQKGSIVALGWGLHWAELWTNVPATGGPHPGNGIHIAFHAPNKEAVDASHRAGTARGGADNGPPGYRTEYDPGYYGAFLLDPDRNRLEAVWLDHGRRRG
jgi:catechol 2,3-dioxygenase-like lactoylglutathione lyase family enzyme